jgi:hypothetical protein
MPEVPLKGKQTPSMIKESASVGRPKLLETEPLDTRLPLSSRLIELAL